MRGRPKMAVFSKPSRRELAKRYRKWAADALRQADVAEPSQRQSFIAMAEKWNHLAEGIEADLINFIEPESEPEQAKPKRKSAHRIPK